ncbi:hypothetical protein PAESOLCIP111_05553 [Paenibacillus solanacearum]|uniref:Fibronectin type-III domain-containing protein n=1 Tax=Paenibacillus solanacearum TaxID=2048548 RepID=A0A916NS94_9BACL|nr:fibronectin type III domain-containing protein [Paenibacillus solanacearum]CAG7648211.1 hypothetical protein PAESOLCIP111_05553 [Paenibacillus solanacearum]
MIGRWRRIVSIVLISMIVISSLTIEYAGAEPVSPEGGITYTGKQNATSDVAPSEYEDAALNKEDDGQHMGVNTKQNEEAFFDYGPPLGFSVADSVYKFVYGNALLYSTLMGPAVRYTSMNVFNGGGIYTYDDTQSWPSLINALSTTYSQEASGYDQKCVLYVDNTVQCRYGAQIYDDTSGWPSLINARSITKNINNYSDYRCVLYINNTVSCRDPWNGPYDDTSGWPNLTNAKAISLASDQNGVGVRCVLYKDNKIRCRDGYGEWEEYVGAWPDLTNSKSFSHHFNPESGEVYNYVAYTNVNPAIEYISNNTQYVNRNTGQYISISGTVRDMDDDNVTISATIAGITKTTVIPSAYNAKSWTLVWNVDSDNIPVGTYSNITVTANDGLWGTAGQNYTGTVYVSNPPKPPANLGFNWNTTDWQWFRTQPQVTWNFSHPDAGKTQSLYHVQRTQSDWNNIDYDTGGVSSSDTYHSMGWSHQGTNYVRVRTADSNGSWSDWSYKTYQFDSNAPNVFNYNVGTTPVNIVDGGTKNISVEVSDDRSGVRLWDAYYQKPDGQWVQAIIRVTQNGSVWTMSVPITLEGNYKVHLYFGDTAGNGAVQYPSELNFAVDRTPPTVPSNLAASNLTATSVVLNWSPSSDSSGISGYNIYRDSALIGTTSGGITSYTATGLSANTTYQFTVAAKDILGHVSNPSNAINVLYDTIPPTAPSISLSNWTLTNVTLTITPGTDNGSGVQKSQYKIGLSGAWTDYVSPVAVGTIGQPTVYARTIDMVGNIGPEASTTIPENVTTNPANLRVVSQSGTTVQLAWDAPKDIVGVVGYDILIGAAVTGTSTTTSYQVTGLTEGATYQFNVRARDAAGNVSGNSNTVSVTIPDYTAPYAPTNLRITDQTGTTINLEWSASSDNIGVTGYDILIGDNIAAASTTTSYQFTGLAEGRTYQFSVRAKDAAQNSSSSSNTVTATIPDYTPPTIPSNLRVANQTGTTAMLNWNASTDNIDVTGYDILQGTVVTGTSSTLSYEITGLNDAASYQFSVRARDAAGNVSGLSNEVNLTLADTTPPAPPANVRVTDRTGNSLTLVWEAVKDNVGISRYDVYMGGNMIGSTATTNFAVSGLSPGATYQFVVKSIDTSGNVSGPSATLTMTTMTPAPGSDSYTSHITLKKLERCCNTTLTTEDAVNWPSVTNAKSISYYTHQGITTVWRYVLYNDLTIRLFKYDGRNIIDAGNDAMIWPSLTNAKTISYSMDGTYEYRCVWYNDNTVKCNKYDFYNYYHTTELIDDSANWPDLSNAREITRYNRPGSLTERRVLFNDNTVKLYIKDNYGYTTVTDETPQWAGVAGARSIAYARTDSYEYRFLGYLDNNPSIQINNNDQTSYVNGTAKTITLSGTASDPNGDNLTISATIAGVTKTTTLYNTATPQPWSLQWNLASDPIPQNTYTNITVMATDSYGASTNALYSGLIRIDRLPNVPNQLSPGNASSPVVISGATPKFSWVFADPDAGDAQMAYQVMVYDQQSNASVIDTGWVTSGSNSFAVPSATLGRGKTYRWQVRVKDSYGGESGISSSAFIQINQIPKIEYTGGEERPNHIYSFNWNYSDGDGQPQASYRIMGSKTNWASTEYDTGVINSTTTSFTTPSLAAGTWSFKIIVSDGLEWSDPMPLGIIDKIPPTVPVKLELVNKNTAAATLAWQPATDNIGVAGYDVYNGDVLVISTTNTGITVPNTVPNRLYIFAVRARDLLGNVSEASNTVYYYNGEYRYVYDAKGRIDYMLLSSGQILKYEYDANGNLLRIVLQ